MENLDVMIEEYKTYVESKDRFVDRSFMVNRFYLLIDFGLLIYLFNNLDHMTTYVPLTVVLTSAIGIATSLLWVLNQDAYANLIKFKLGGVIEKMEESLPFQPHKLEYESIKKRNEKKRVMFVDIQKGLAFCSMCVFFSIFVYTCGLKILEFIS